MVVFWDMDDEWDVRDELGYLWSKVLLLDGVVLFDGKKSYCLYDLFYYLVWNLLSVFLKLRCRGDLVGLGIGLVEVYGIFLEKYRRLIDNYFWYILFDDGYIY